MRLATIKPYVHGGCLASGSGTLRSHPAIIAKVCLPRLLEVASSLSVGARLRTLGFARAGNSLSFVRSAVLHFDWSI